MTDTTKIRKEVERIYQGYSSDLNPLLAIESLVDTVDALRVELASCPTDMQYKLAEAEVTRLRSALVDCVIPYEALLLDHKSRKWIAPEVWAHIERTALQVRAVLAQARGTP